MKRRIRAMAENRKDKNILCSAMPFAAQEAYKRLRTNILFSFSAEDNDSECHVIGITSPDPANGKSTVAINLSYVLAEAGSRVVLIDGDMRKPALHEKLELNQTPGLSNLVSGVNPGQVAQRFTDNDVSFMVVTAGDIPPNPSELLQSDKMKALLEGLRTKTNFIIIDLPPVSAVTDAQAISKLADGMILVLRSGHCDADMVAATLRQFELSKAKVLGFVLNGAELVRSKKSGYGYGYGSYGDYKNYGYYKSADNK